MLERLGHRQVGVVELDVLADEGDTHLAVAGADALDQPPPVGEVGRRRRRRPRRWHTTRAKPSASRLSGTS